MEGDATARGALINEEIRGRVAALTAGVNCWEDRRTGYRIVGISLVSSQSVVPAGSSVPAAATSTSI